MRWRGEKNTDSLQRKKTTTNIISYHSTNTEINIGNIHEESTNQRLMFSVDHIEQALCIENERIKKVLKRYFILIMMVARQIKPKNYE